jgi:hypothetical protein
MGMKTPYRYIFACLTGLAVFGWFGEPASAYTLKSAEGGISAEFKSEPKFEKFNETTKSGQPYIRYQWLLDEGATAWIVTYNDYKAGSIKKVGLERAYEGAVSGGAGANKLRSKQLITRSGITGRAALVDIPADKPTMVMQQWLFIKGDRLYQAIYVGPQGSENNPEVSSFMENFRIE